MEVNFGDVEVGDVLSLLAIVVSLVALLRPWWQERKAIFDVRNEHVKSANTNVKLGTERYIVKNHGPAAARDVEVAVWYKDRTKSFRPVGWNELRTPVLHPGEELQLNYILNMGDDMPEQVEVSWRDGRLRKQTHVAYPRVREIFIT